MTKLTIAFVALFTITMAIQSATGQVVTNTAVIKYQASQ